MEFSNIKISIGGHSFIIAIWINLLIAVPFLNAQESSSNFTEQDKIEALKQNPTLEKVRFDENQNVLKFVKFKKDNQPTIESLSSVINEIMYNSSKRVNNQEIEYILVEEKTDKLGFTQLKYKQIFNGIPVDLALFKVQVSDRNIISIMGRIYSEIYLSSTTAKIGLDQSAKQALGFYCQDNPNCNPQLMDSMPPELTIIRKEGIDHLSWKFNISNHGHEVKEIYVDSNTGKVVEHFNLYSNCNNANGYTTMYGYQSGVKTDYVSGNYILHDDCSYNVNVHVKDWNSETSTSNNPLEYKDANNSWNDNSRDKSAYQSLWGTSQALEYLDLEHGRNSFDDQGTLVKVFNEAMFYSIFGYYGNNASFSWTTATMKIGRGDNANDGNDDINSTDVIAHELFHGVTGSSAGLIYSSESGALNESFSDIFGVDFERWEEGTSSPSDWLIGEDLAIGAIRSMEDPNLYNDPDCYGGTFWSSNGGVHTNSGVQNHWFYLLSEGGNGTNDVGDTYSVTGVGTVAARDVAFRTLTVKLTDPSSSYLDARDASIEAAEDLSGNDPCSNLVEQVTNAWYAVGVGDEFDPCVSNPDLYITAESVSNTNPDFGNSVTLSCNQHVSNASVGYLSPYPWVGYYVSDNTTWDNSDYLVAVNYSSIGTADPFDFETTTVNVSTSWGYGTKYILFVADYKLQTTESNENNNVNFVQINLPTAPDIFTSSEYITDFSPDIGQTVTLSCFQYASNASVSIINPYPYLGYYYSTNTTWDNNDVLIGNDWSSVGTSDYYDYESLNYTIPNWFGTGTKYILFVADYTNNVVESNENNNVKYITIDVGPGKGGLSEFSDNNSSDENQGSFSMYPNPAKDYVNLNFDNMKGIENIAITDFTGKQIMAEFTDCNDQNMTINISDINTGYYILTVTYDTGKSLSKKLLVQNDF